MGAAAARERFVVLGVAPVRAGWFRSVGVWSTSGALPAEFVRCLSVEEARARLQGAQPFSALLIDANVPGADRDLLRLAAAAACPVLVVDNDHPRHDWTSLGATCVLDPAFDRDDLVKALSSCARPVPMALADLDLDVERFLRTAVPRPPAPLGPLVAVTGAGGTGASICCIALAQALGARALRGPGSLPVVLADLRLHAEQAMLHDAAEVGPGIQELVEAHRSGRPNPDSVRAVTFDVSDRGYHLLLGLRRARFWPVLRPQSVSAAVESLRAAFSAVVCDIDCDLEGVDGGGSCDVEERNVMARTAGACADAVLVVGLATTKGLHSLLRVMGDVAELGVSPERILPVLNRTPRSPRLRARLAATVADLGATAARGTPGGLVFLPECDIEDELRDALPLPAGFASLLAGAVAAVVGRAQGPGPGVDQNGGGGPTRPLRVRPGSLGAWATQ